MGRFFTVCLAGGFIPGNLVQKGGKAVIKTTGLFLYQQRRRSYKPIQKIAHSSKSLSKAQSAHFRTSGGGSGMRGKSRSGDSLRRQAWGLISLCLPFLLSKIGMWDGICPAKKPYFHRGLSAGEIIRGFIRAKK